MSGASVALTARKRPSRFGRLLAAARGHIALVVAALTLVIAWGGLMITQRGAPAAFPRASALHAALIDPPIARMLASTRWQQVDVIPMDRREELLGFYRGPRLVASVTLGYRRGVAVLDASDQAREQYAYGSNIANNGWVLGALSIVFVLMTAVWPLRRVRNLDAMVAVSLTLSVVVFNTEMLGRLVPITYPALVYLATRCAWWGLVGPASSPVTPLYQQLTRRWSERQRVRVLRWIAGAIALIVVMVGFTSLHIVDVAYAAMEGATQLVHGVLPYGHIPDVFHGDTYPIGSYFLYVPFALAWPVHSVWDRADVTLAVAVIAALLSATGLWRLVTRVSESTADGLRTAVAVLTFPPLLVTVSTGTTDAVLAALLVGVLALWQRPAGGSAMLSAAAWFKATPVVLIPLWLSRLRGASLARAALALLLVSVAMLAALIGIGGIAAPTRMLHAMSFQLTRSSPQNPWPAFGGSPVKALAEAMTLALLVGACIRIRRDRDLAGDLARVAAIAAAVLLGVQISDNYWSYMYLVWLIPLILVSLLGDRAIVSAGSRRGATRQPDFSAKSRSGLTEDALLQSVRPTPAGPLNSSTQFADKPA